MRAAMFTAAAAAPVLFVALASAPEPVRIPAPTQLPPVPLELLRPAAGTVTVRLRDVRFTTRLGHRVSVPEVELVLAAPTSARAPDSIHAQLVRIRGLEVITPPDTIVTPLDPFMTLPGPRLRVDRLVLADAFLGTLAHPAQHEGRWLWRARDVDLEARDVHLGRGGTERLAVTRLDFEGELRGRGFRVQGFDARLSRTSSVLTATSVTDLGRSVLHVDGRLLRGGAYAVTLSAAPLAFTEVRAFVPSLPDGEALISTRIDGGGGATSFHFDTVHVVLENGTIAANGRVRTGDGARADSLTIVAERVSTRSLGAALAGWLEAEEWSGRLQADGTLSEGVRVEARLAGIGPADRSPRLAAHGLLRDDGRVRLELDARADDVAFEAPGFGIWVANVQARSAGALDSLRITADAEAAPARGPRAVASAAPDDGNGADADGARLDRLNAELEMLLTDPPGAPRRLRADANVSLRAAAEADASLRADATITFGETPFLEATVAADSLPVRILPVPSALDSVRGVLEGRIRAVGAVDRPVLSGVLSLHDAAFVVPSARLGASDVSAAVRIESDVLILDRFTGRANGGTLAGEGSIAFAGEHHVDLRFRAEGVRLAGDDTAAVTVGAHAEIAGPLERPVATGGAVLWLARAGIETRRLAEAAANVVLASDGEIDAELTADSLPLAALPAIRGVSDLEGAASASLRLSGTIERPRLDGAAALDRAGLRVTRTGTELRELDGRVSMEDGLLRVERLIGRAGAGTVAVSGGARLASGPRALDLTVLAEGARLVSTDSAVVIASAEVRATGSLDLPQVNGVVTLESGRVHEDNFKREAPLDLEMPDYAELAAAVPWIRESRLQRARGFASRTEPPSAGAFGPDSLRRMPSRIPDGPPLRGRIVVRIEPGMHIVDEDSEMYGTGEVLVTADSTGIHTAGLYRIEGGYYAQYGEVMEVAGGVFRFTGRGFEPYVTLRSVHDPERPLGTGLGDGLRAFDAFPPLESFAIGTIAGVSEEARRLSLLPESRTSLGSLLLFGLKPEPVTGIDPRPLWAPGDEGGFVGERAATQSLSLLWSYAANETYDFIPLERASFGAGIISVGSDFPGRIVMGPYLAGLLRLGRLESLFVQPAIGETGPGVRLRYRVGATQLIAFDEPRFYSIVAAGGTSGFGLRRRTGLGLRWEWSF